MKNHRGSDVSQGNPPRSDGPVANGEIASVKSSIVSSYVIVQIGLSHKCSVAPDVFDELSGEGCQVCGSQSEPGSLSLAMTIDTVGWPALISDIVDSEEVQSLRRQRDRPGANCLAG